MKKNMPYIGVTGFMSRNEVEKVLAEFPKDSVRKFMVGVLASTTTLYGEKPSRLFGRYPIIQNIEDIFSPDTRAFNVIHFNDKTREMAMILNQLLVLTKLGGKHLHGFQLNIKWPHPFILNMFKKVHPDKKIILQLGREAFKDVDSSPARMAEKVRVTYNELIDYLLIDPSAGEGREFDLKMALSCLRALKERCNPLIGFGIAGGLYDGNAEKLLSPVVAEFSDISTDTEGKMRDKELGDALNIDRAIRYVKTVYGIIKKL